MFKNTSRGLSLVGVIVGFAVLGILFAAGNKMIRSGIDVTKVVKERQDLTEIRNFIRVALDCNATAAHSANKAFHPWKPNKDIGLFGAGGRELISVKGTKFAEKYTVFAETSTSKGDFVIRYKKGDFDIKSKKDIETEPLFKRAPMNCPGDLF